MEEVLRPWGSYVVVFTEKDFQVKRLTVFPGQRLSLQSHEYRAEHWFVVSGHGSAQIGEKIESLEAGKSLDLGIGTKHRLCCTSSQPLVVVEIQTGVSFSEDDITRFEDDYGRD